MFFVLCMCVEGEWNISIPYPKGSLKVVKGQMDFSLLVQSIIFRLRHATINQDSVVGGAGFIYHYILDSFVLWCIITCW